jgi:fibronectin type 3 domain-containing protein
VPGAPTLTSATPGNASVALAWSPPGFNGGAAITGYKVFRGTSSGGETLLATLGNVTSSTDTTAATGTTYDYEVAALTAGGEGAVSNELSATPAVPDAVAPSKPSSLKLVIAGTNQLALDWPASLDNVGVVGYRVYRNNVLVATVARTAYLDSGLAAGTSYTYAVRAIDAAGNASAASGNLNAKTVAASTSTTGTLGGAVYDTTGQPLANAVVTLVVGGSTKKVKTNSAGAWKIGNVSPATYAPNVSLSGYQPQTLSMTAVGGKTVLAATFLVRS